MKQHLSEAQLNDVADGVPAAHERSDLDAHLAECERCREEVQAIRALTRDIGRLPTSIAPATDLRAGIVDRISRMTPVDVSAAGRAETAGTQVDESGRNETLESARPRRRPRILAMLAAAAMLVLATATLTRWWVLTEPPSTRAPVSGTSAGPGAQHGAPAAVPVSFRSEEARYLAAIADLQNTLDRERAELAPQTISILERNMAIIDRAIAESRAALAQDPANRDLGRLVLSAYEQKLQLLHRARVSAL